MKANLARSICILLTFGAIATAAAQSTWSFIISDAGGGNSLATWNVSGSLATSPGAVLLMSEADLVVSINAPGIFTDIYAANGTVQSIPTPDGSSFQYTPATVYAPILSYSANNAPDGGNDAFSLIAHLLPHTGAGTQLLYNPGMQSVLLPIDFSNFNPGTYQSQELIFNTVLTMSLTIEPVPEPSTLELIFGMAICAASLSKKSKWHATEQKAI